MADELGNTVACKVSHEALRAQADRVHFSGSDSAVFQAYRELIEELASDAFDAEGPFDNHGPRAGHLRGAHQDHAQRLASISPQVINLPVERRCTRQAGHSYPTGMSLEAPILSGTTPSCSRC
jgi:hypothetical protein